MTAVTAVPAAVTRNLPAIGMLTLSMLLFAIEDMFIKKAAADIQTGQILIILSAIGTCFFLVVCRLRGEWPRLSDLREPPLVIRTVGEMVGTIGFVTALTLIPLSTATAIFQATPLAVTVAAALFLREAVGWRRWSAVTVGFLGVVLIIRPGMEGFDANALFALLAVVGLAARDVATRRLPAHLSTSLVSAYAFASLSVAGVILMATGQSWQPVATGPGLLIGAAACVGIAGYYTITTAMRIGETSVIAPFRYSRLLFALIIGYIFFQERPDAITLTGAAIIIGSGLYALYRERVRATARLRQSRAAPPSPPPSRPA